ncbi:MAG: hypothetical protein IJ365_04875, partial [Clostridia bacterium]|nr:hypothetical protein [Clostridia bacterium]
GFDRFLLIRFEKIMVEKQVTNLLEFSRLCKPKASKNFNISHVDNFDFCEFPSPKMWIKMWICGLNPMFAGFVHS